MKLTKQQKEQIKKNIAYTNTEYSGKYNYNHVDYGDIVRFLVGDPFMNLVNCDIMSGPNICVNDKEFITANTRKLHATNISPIDQIKNELFDCILGEIESQVSEEDYENSDDFFKYGNIWVHKNKVGFDFYLHSYNRYTTRYGIYLRDMSNYKFNGSLVPIMDMLDLGERDEK